MKPGLDIVLFLFAIVVAILAGMLLPCALYCYANRGFSGIWGRIHSFFKQRFSSNRKQL